MKQYFDIIVKPASERMYDLLTADFDPYSNSYMVVRNGKQVRKVIVDDLLGAHVEYKLKNGKLEVVRDWELVPF